MKTSEKKCPFLKKKINIYVCMVTGDKILDLGYCLTGKQRLCANFIHQTREEQRNEKVWSVS